VANATGLGFVPAGIEALTKLNLAVADMAEDSGAGGARVDLATVIGVPELIAQGTEQAAKDAAKTAADLAEQWGGPVGEGIAGFLRDNEDKIAQTGYAAGLAGPLLAPTVVAIKVGAEAVSAGIKATLGPEAEKDVRNFVAQFDPTSSKSPAGEFIGALGMAVKAAPFLPPPPSAPITFRSEYGPDWLAANNIPAPEPMTAAQIQALKEESAAEAPPKRKLPFAKGGGDL
jgi:hypothetical protein